MVESRDAALKRVLNLVAEGRLTADEAAPILDALTKPDRDEPAGRQAFASEPPPAPEPPATPSEGSGTRPRFARIQVIENGRRAVDLRVPVGLGRFALSKVPGLSVEQIDEVQDALASGSHGPILDVQDVDGDGVRISLE
jgi:SHOCT-like protein